MNKAETQICHICHRRQSLDDFYCSKSNNGIFYRRHTCKGCTIARQRELEAKRGTKAKHAQNSLAYYYRNRDRILGKKG
jgi:hypothetical protein